MGNGSRHQRTCRSRKALVAAALGGAALLGSTPAWSQADDLVAAPPSVGTDRGNVVGTRVGTVAAFLGVPYAAPPVGDLRFRPPRRHAAWTAPVQATQVAQPCPQNRQAGANGPVPIGSEDCLYLNVWTPAQAQSERRPVMVWFPGGGFQQGGATFPYYNSQYIAEQAGVVVVTVTYRVGVLGNLTAQALDQESPAAVSGNYGLQDQQAALRWVRRNIAAFGGDPQNVTIFGESAGGNSVEYQLASPLVRGLFKQAIIESAAGIQLIPDLPLAASETAGSATVLASVGCADAADVAACLRALPAAAFLGASGVTEPVVDGYVLPLRPLQAFRSGAFNRVPTILGSNHDEATAFVWPIEAALGGPLTLDGYTAQLDRMYGANAPAVLEQYPLSAYPTPIQALAAAETDSALACPAALKRKALSRHVPVFGYEFNEPDPAQGALLGPPEPGLDYGAYHTADLPYVFSVSAPNGDRVAGKDLALSQRIIAYWTNLAISGNPDQPQFQLPFWIDYRAQPLLLSLKDQVTYLPESQFSAEHHCAFWSPILPDNL